MLGYHFHHIDVNQKRHLCLIKCSKSVNFTCFGSNIKLFLFDNEMHRASFSIDFQRWNIFINSWSKLMWCSMLLFRVAKCREPDISLEGKDLMYITTKSAQLCKTCLIIQCTIKLCQRTIQLRTGDSWWVCT